MDPALTPRLLLCRGPAMQAAAAAARDSSGTARRVRCSRAWSLAWPLRRVRSAAQRVAAHQRSRSEPAAAVPVLLWAPVALAHVICHHVGRSGALDELQREAQGGRRQYVQRSTRCGRALRVARSLLHHRAALAACDDCAVSKHRAAGPNNGQRAKHGIDSAARLSQLLGACCRVAREREAAVQRTNCSAPPPSRVGLVRREAARPAQTACCGSDGTLIV